jgi:hypothetical protein
LAAHLYDLKEITNQEIMSNPKVFSIHGLGLKLSTKEDIEPHISLLRAQPDVEEIHIGGT